MTMDVDDLDATTTHRDEPTFLRAGRAESAAHADNSGRRACHRSEEVPSIGHLRLLVRELCCSHRLQSSATRSSLTFARRGSRNGASFRLVDSGWWIVGETT